MLSLDPSRIDLWCAYLDEIKENALLAQYKSLLSEEECSAIPSFLFVRDQHRYLVTRTLVRMVLSRYAPIEPNDWIFETNDYGRPKIANKNCIAEKICFNISHTQGLIILGVSGCQDLGVDVENKNENKMTTELARNFLSASELASLYALPEKEKQERSLQYWTLKEAYIKARSMGLSIPLDQFSFHFNKKQIRISMQAELNDSPECWRFWQLRLSHDYLVAICASCENSKAQQLVLKKIIPTQTESELDYTLLLHSR